MTIEAGKLYKDREGRRVEITPWGKEFCSMGHVDGAYRVYSKDGSHGSEHVPNNPALDLIEEWIDTPQPTLWRDMTDAEQGALLLAKHRGEELQMLIGDEWFDHDGIFAVNVAYRVKPKPVVEVLKLEMRVSPNGCLYQSVNSPPQYLFSVDRVDGEIDCSSAVMVKL